MSCMKSAAAVPTSGPDVRKVWTGHVPDKWTGDVPDRPAGFLTNRTGDVPDTVIGPLLRGPAGSTGGGPSYNRPSQRPTNPSGSVGRSSRAWARTRGDSV